MTLTESAWLSSTSPDALRRHVLSVGVGGDVWKAFVVECRRAYWPNGTFDPIYDVEMLAHMWAVDEWPKNATIQPDPRCNILRDVAGNPWRKMELPKGDPSVISTCGICMGEPVPGSCLACGGRPHRQEYYQSPWLTPEVLNIASSLRENPHDAGAWAGLHDALLEAGCDNADILQHCLGLGRCPTCEGTGIGACPDIAEYIEIANGCPRCNGTGWTPLPKIDKGPHTRNCWVLRLLGDTIKATT